MHTEEQTAGWRPAEVGAGLVVGAAVGAVFWGLTAPFVAGGGYKVCRIVPRGYPSGAYQGSQLWIPLKYLCSADGFSFSPTSGIVTLLWSFAALVLMSAVAIGLSLLLYGLIRWLVPHRRRTERAN